MFFSRSDCKLMSENNERINDGLEKGRFVDHKKGRLMALKKAVLVDSNRGEGKRGSFGKGMIPTTDLCELYIDHHSKMTLRFLQIVSYRRPSHHGKPSSLQSIGCVLFYSRTFSVTKVIKMYNVYSMSVFHILLHGVNDFQKFFLVPNAFNKFQC